MYLKFLARRPAWLFCVLAVTIIAATHAQSGKGVEYVDGRGGKIYFPAGDRSFADEVVSFEKGTPDAGPVSERPEQTLGTPDYDGVAGDNYLTLGCGGELLLAFTDNALVDVPGPDLYVFEIGPNVEATGMAISVDGESWTKVGMIVGGKAQVDIAPYATPGETYRYVKLVDLKQSCSAYPGADIDAVGAIGSARKFTLDSAVLFDTGKYELRAEAQEALRDVLNAIAEVDATRLTVEGHTDSVGSDEDNLLLSKNRAASVAAFFVSEGGFSESMVLTEAHGESRPVATNDTDEGKQKNRRVEITAAGAATIEVDDPKLITILGVWETSEGLLELQETSDGVYGVYGTDGGRVMGTFTSDTRFEGLWIGRSSQQACGKQNDGSAYWGALVLEFDGPERDSFKGVWSYCEETPESTGWDGQRLL